MKARGRVYFFGNMKKIRNPFKNLNKFEWALWVFSFAAIISSFFAVGSTAYANLAASLLGVTSLIFAARGDAFGLMLMMTFSAIYAFVAFTTKYYGEMIIYLGMQIPCATASLISWLRHPSDKGSAEVKIGKFNKKHVYILIPLTAAIVTAFYFVLKTLGTENLIVSTVSVGTSFVALYLMTLRIPAYALVFILNDIVLIVLWSMACANDLNHLALVVCFSIFLINDTYTFICWTRRKARQDRKFNEQPDPLTEES